MYMMSMFCLHRVLLNGGMTFTLEHSGLLVAIQPKSGSAHHFQKSEFMVGHPASLITYFSLGEYCLQGWGQCIPALVLNVFEYTI